LCTQFFITNDKANVTGLILAGLADFKNDLFQSDLFDPRLKTKVVKILDVSYGGDNGFNQAIELAADALANVKFIQEKKLISKYFDEIAQDTGKYCYGVKDTFYCLEMGAVEELIVWENLQISRFILKNPQTLEEKIYYFTPEEEKKRENFVDNATNAELEIILKENLLDWLAENYKKYGAVLEIVTNKSQEGSQFVKGFGGIGGLLRYRVDTQTQEEVELKEEEDLDEFF